MSDQAGVNGSRVSWFVGPTSEWHAAYLVKSALESLDRHIEGFAAAVAIYDFSIALPNNAPEWKFVAGRDGAMTIYHFGVVIEGIRKSLAVARTLGQSVNHDIIRDAQKKFRLAFPDATKLRDGVSHIAEKMKTTDLHKEHSIRGALTITDAYVGRVFIISWEGDSVTYEVSESSLRCLQEIRDSIWSSFLPPAPSTQNAPLP